MENYDRRAPNLPLSSDRKYGSTLRLRLYLFTSLTGFFIPCKLKRKVFGFFSVMKYHGRNFVTAKYNLNNLSVYNFVIFIIGRRQDHF